MVSSYWVTRMTDEIRSLRAENKELRDSYERVEKYAAELIRQREEQADMIRTINPLYR